MKERSSDLSDLDFRKSRSRYQGANHQHFNHSDTFKRKIVRKFDGSFNSNTEVTPTMDIYPVRAKFSEIPVSDSYKDFNMSIERQRREVSKNTRMRTSQSFVSNEKVFTPPLDIATHSETEIKVKKFSKKEEKPNSEIVDSKNTPKMQQTPAKPLLKKIKQEIQISEPMSEKKSYFEQYIEKHPDFYNFQSKKDKTQQIFGKANNNKNHAIKEHMRKYKNLELKHFKLDGCNIKFPSPSMSIPNLQIDKKPSRASTKQKLVFPSSSRDKNSNTGLNLNERFQKRGLEDKKAKTKNDVEFNHVFKILDFLGNDKGLKEGRAQLQKKIRNLGKDIGSDGLKKVSVVDQAAEASFLKEYKIKGVLGKGSYGEVRLAIHTKTDELFAVKMYPRKFLNDKIKNQNIQNEKDLLNQIDHPHIIKLFKVVEGVQTIWFVTEYAGKRSLHEVLSDGMNMPTLTEDEARPVIWQLCQTLIYLHKENIIHRDIKLHNILINDDHQLKLIDFGFALKLKPEDKIHVFCGTPSYMSPEIVNRTPYDGKSSDIWALGVCAYRMIVGTFPFRGDLISSNRRRSV